MLLPRAQRSARTESVHVIVYRLHDVHILIIPLTVAATRECPDSGDCGANQRGQPTRQGCDLFCIALSRMHPRLFQQLGGIGCREQQLTRRR